MPMIVYRRRRVFETPIRVHGTDSDRDRCAACCFRSARTESIPKPAADAGGADFLDAAREVLDLLDDRVEIAAEARRAGLAVSHMHRHLQEYQQTRLPPWARYGGCARQ